MIGGDLRAEVRGGTLVALLRARAAEHPERTAFTFLADGRTEEARLTWGELDRRARGIAAAIAAGPLALPPGERALLLYPPGLDFIAAFFGCLYAGVVAVPAYPPRPNQRSQSRLRAIAADAAPRAALTTSALLGSAEALAAAVPELAPGRVLWLATDGAPGELAAAWDGPAPDGSALAFLQYTSGSTATPKGVMVTHANLVDNERAIGAAFGLDEESVVVGWLPLYHDMGLIGNVLQPLHAGARCVLMPPVAFLQRPLSWLEAISRYRATVSGGPNFAYELCARRIAPAERHGLDLASWTVAFNGAEPVRAETLERFAAAFAPYGFRREAFYPCYGLAEATLFVTGPQRGAGATVATVEAAALAADRVVPAPAGEPSGDGRVRRLVGCGRPWGEERVVIADPETGAELAPGRVGEVWVAGPSVARGYWRRPEETERLFGAFLADGRGPYLRTGDLGFLGRAGDLELFVTGRAKDLIIVRGRNHYPQDLELTAEASHPDLKPGGGAAFSVEADGEERLVLVHEVERRRGQGEADLLAIAEVVRRAIAEEHEVQVHDVVLLRSGTLPKTSSGKVQRHACRAGYLAGTLAAVGGSALARRPAAGAAAPAPTRAALAALDPVPRRAALLAWLGERAAALAGLGEARPEPEQALTGLGLDSLGAAELQAAVEGALGVAVPLPGLLGGWGTGALADHVLAGLAGGAGGEPPATIAAAPAVDTPTSFPLSAGQKALWFLERLAPQGGGYNVVTAVRAPAGLDAASLRRALARLVARHPALGATFPAETGEPVQRISSPAAPEVREEDAAASSEQRLGERLVEEAFRAFDLERGPLLRLHLFARAGGERVLLLAIHHLVTDFWSFAVLARDLSALYREETGGPAAELPPLAATYAGWVRTQDAALAGPQGERLWAYWRQRLAGPPPDLDLPTDRPRPAVQTFRGAAAALPLPGELAARLRALARDRGATLFAVLLAAFEALLGRLSGQEDFAVGSPTSGRTGPRASELAGLVGYFVNPVPLRADLAGDPPFAELLARVRQATIEALEHADFPLPFLVERLQPARDPARSPLYQAMLVLQDARPGELPGIAALSLGVAGAWIDFGGLPLESVALPERRVQLDLTLRAAPFGDGLGTVLEHNTDLFDHATAERWLGHLRTLLEGIAAEPGRRVSELPLLSVAERAQLVGEWNATARELPRGVCLHDLVASQAARTPAAEAVVAGGERLTYQELAARAGRLARRLRELGVGPEVTVGLHLGRSADLVVSVLAVLEAGGAYVPLDPAYPRERLELMLEDSGARVVVTEGGEGGLSAPCRLDLAAERDRIAALPAGPLPAAASPGNLAYLIYTSGSTGRPKAVAIEHRSAVALVEWTREAFSAEELAGVLFSTSLAFDLSVFELFAPLARGGRVIVAADALELPRLPAASEVTLVNTVPSAMAELVRGDGLPASVRTVNLAGEPIPPALVAALHAMPAVERIVNLYGPSEDTTYSTFAPLPRGLAGAPPIGCPIANTRAWVLDRGGELAPVGVPGELCLAGAGLARGYLGRPELTAERFVPDPFGAPGGEPGGRLYRTGDLARVRPDGTLDFLGRLDHQVKVRGFRIELGEIEATLASHPAVRAAAVVVADRGEGDRRLAAFVVPAADDAAPDPGLLRTFLRDRLPAHMVPAAVTVLPALPLSPNGKVDRRALAALALAAPGPAAAEGTAPRTPSEELLAGIWSDLLGMDRVPVDASFFELGGHSLLAMRLLSRVADAFGVELAVGEVFAAPTVAGLAERIEAAGREGRRAAAPPLVRVPREGDLPLSFAQERLWFLDRLEPGSPVYNLPAAIRLAGRLSVAALAAALAGVARRHEALRTTFAAVGGRPVQVIHPRPALPLPVVDLGGCPEPARQLELDRLAGAEAARPFDLARGPLARTTLVATEPDAWTLLVTLHHAIADGWSLGVLARELSALYGAFAAGRPSPLAELPVQYADVAVWQRRWLAGEALDGLLAAARGRLAGAPAVLELPTDRPRPPVQSFRGARTPVVLSAALRDGLFRLCRRQGATPYMTLLAAFQAVLARHTGQLDLLVGSPVANRTRVESEGLIGLFVNTLVLRGDLAGDPPFTGLLARTRRDALAAYADQDLPFERLVEAWWVGAPPEPSLAGRRPHTKTRLGRSTDPSVSVETGASRDLSRNPLFQVMLALQNAPPVELALPGLALALEETDAGTSRLDLSLSLAEREGGIAGFLEYATALFDRATVERLLGHFATLLGAALATPELPLSELPLLSAAERHQLLVTWNDTAAPPADPVPVHELVARRAALAPAAPAVAAGPARVSYGELEARAARLARHLVDLGVGPEVRVGVCLPRSPELVVALYAVLKAGGAYVPLDPDVPELRLAGVLADAGAPLLLTWAGKGVEPSPGCLALRLEEVEPALAATAAPALPARRVVPEGLAYVIYTSGSTGVPKGVEIHHAGLSSLVAWHLAAYGVTPADRVTQVASPAFDASVWEIWPALAAGASLHLPDDRVRAAPAELVRWLAAQGITLSFLPTPLAESVLAERWPRGTALRALLTGGDRLSAPPPPGFPCPLVNHYGPTEATVVATAAVALPGRPGAPPIGRPIANARAYVLDGALAPVPVGVAGELWLGGAGVARGYLGRPDLTAERFLPDPFAALAGAPGGRLYRTGDLVRRRPDGELEFLGRVDQQVKVRGFRIEPGEIESALAAHPAVREAAVVAREDRPGELRLVAFVVRAAESEAAGGELRAHLAARLPEHMVPPAFVLLPALPLTPNGKVDRRALARLDPAALGAAEAPRTEAVPPATPAEELVAGIWREVLGVEEVGVHDGFFELGGHSLLAVRVASRLSEALGEDVPVALLFEATTIAELAVRLPVAERGGDVSLGTRLAGRRPHTKARPEGDIPPSCARAGGPLSFAQLRLWFLERLRPGTAAYNIAGAVEITGELDRAAFDGALSGVVARQEALRTTFATEDGEPVQVIAPPSPFVSPFLDLGGLPAPRRQAEAERLIRVAAGRPFDLAAGPLHRFALLRLGAREHLLLVILHHIVADGWSLAVFLDELAELYAAGAAGEPSPLPALPIQYADYAARQREELAGEALAAQLGYWRERLAGTTAPELPADRPRPALSRQRGGVRTAILPAELERELGLLGRAAGATPFMILLAALQALLERSTGEPSVAVGSAVSNRRRVELEGVIGLFVNTLVLRTSLAGDPTGRELLARVREVCLGAYAHQDLPFERLVEELAPERRLAQNPLFSVLFVLDEPLPPRRAAGLALTPRRVDTGTAKLDLTLSVLPGAAGLEAIAEYDADLFEPATIDRLLGHWRSLLAGMAADPEARVAELPLLSAAERAQLVEWSATARELPRGLCLHDLVAAQAACTPAAEAVVAGNERLTYAELTARAARLARRLRELGVGPEVRVGLHLGRTADLVVSVLAVLEAGGAYVPLDPAYPRERLELMLADSGARVVITDRRGGEGPTSPYDLDLTAERDRIAALPAGPLPPAAGPGNLAYLIYTSGSTGRPKAVAIEHRSAVALVLWTQEAFSPEELAGVLFSTSLAFDLSVFELFAPLARGGRVIVADDALALPRLPAASEVTLVNTVPSAMAELVREHGLPGSVHTVNLAGEPIPPALVAALHAVATVERVVNLYGPSEDTTYSTFAPLPRGLQGAPPIGRPVAGTRAWVLDRRPERIGGEPLPVGIPGELHLGGAGLARGYLGRPELTAERFVPDPFGGEPGARLYRTGDLARLRPDGSFDFLGRLDDQVKVRGFRIELGEIEAALARHPGVREAAVVVRQEADGDRRLVAFVVPATPATPATPADTAVPPAAGDARRDDGGDLRAFLRERLPEYMVPSAFVDLATLPLSPNGKVDRRALALAAPAPAAAPAGTAPRTPAEELLAGLWAEVLGLPEVGVHDDFFALGGHSLLATRLVSRIAEAFGVELPVAAVFQDATVARLAERLQAAGAGRERPAPPVARPRQALLPLSFAQRRLWLLDRLEPGGTAYNLAVGVRLSGELGIAALAAGLAEILARHEALRTVFAEVDGEPVQVIQPPPAAGPDLLPVVDLGGLPEELARAAGRAAAARFAAFPFDLERGPVARFLLLRAAPREHALVAGFHHIATDGWSMHLFFRELAALYAATSAGRPSPLPEPPLQYADYAVWQRRALEGGALERQLAHWRQHLAGLPALELPTDRPRPPVATARGGSRPLTLPAGLVEGLAALCRRERVTLFMALLAGFEALLARLSGQHDFAVGAPTAGRTRVETEGVIGFFVNTLVLRADLAGDPGFRTLLRRSRAVVLAADANGEVPFEKLVEELAPERSPGRAPLVQVMLAFLAAPRDRIEIPGLALELLDLPSDTAKFDLTLALHERDGRVTGLLEHRADLFETATAERLAGHLLTLLAGAAAEPERRLSELPLLGPAERAQLVAEWNDTAAALPAVTVHGLVAAQAARTPDAVAAESGDAQLSYGELLSRAGRLARRLRTLGVGPEARVAICAERSLEMLVGLLGVLEAGGAYVPLDPEYPAERLALMIADAGAAVLLTQERLLAALPAAGLPVVLLDAAQAEPPGTPAMPATAPVDPDHLMYVIYTSGSTGRPKGVMVRHLGVVNRLLGVQPAYPVTPADRVLQKASFSFDFSVWECFGPLLAGARVVLARPGGHRDPGYLAAAIAERGVTLVHFVPSMLGAFLAEEGLERLASLCHVFAGGEAMTPELVAQFDARMPPGVPLHNQYGPTEITIDTTDQICLRRAAAERVPRGGSGRPKAAHEDPPRGTRSTAAFRPVPIGRPLPNTVLHVLDSALQPVPPGVPGELFLGGAGVARGYLGRPALTAERFVPDPFAVSPGARLYRSGDLGRRLADGTLEFLGRIDQQVKVRGFRIEPGEVEAVLVAHPAVREAAVVARGEGAARRLLAYVVPEDGALRPEELRSFLAGRLPEYMVPAAFVALDRLPLTPSGKLDRRALPEPDAAALATDPDAGRPRGQVEELLAGIWADVLGVGRVGIHDGFFDLGGHSLLATQLMSRVRKAFGVELPLAGLFAAPTVAAQAVALAAALQRSEAAAAPPLVRREPGAEPPPLSFAQERLWFLDRLEPGPLYNIPVAARLSGPLDVAALAAALAGIARRHEALRTRFAEVAGRPVQVIEPAAGERLAALPVVDLTALPVAARQPESWRLAAAEAMRPFDLAAGPVWRTALLVLGAGEHLLLLSVHHIAADGWSMGVLLRELQALYTAAAAGRPSPLPELPVQYADFAVWQRRWLAGPVLERELAHWREALAGAPEALELPADRPRPPVPSFRGGRRPAAIGADLLAGITALCRTEGLTPFMVLLAAFEALLGRYGGQDDVVVGSPIANRNRLEIEGLIGFFANTLVLRLDLAGDPSLRELARRARRTTLDAYAHQDLPFEKLVEELAPERDLSRNPLFQVMLVLGNAPFREPDLPGLTVEVAEPEAGLAKFDLVLALGEGGAGLAGGLEYSRDLFDAATVDRLLGHLTMLLAGALADPERPLTAVPILTPAERGELLAWNETAMPAPRGTTVHALVANRAALSPDATAAVYGHERLSYGELVRRARHLARHLRAMGVGPDVPAGIFMERSLDMLVAVLAVLEAGGAYLPLDPAYPAERIELMLADAAAPVVLTQGSLAASLPHAGARLLFVPEALATAAPADAEADGPPAAPENLGYVVYTSGSTGRPKGIAMPHAALVNLLAWQLVDSTAGPGTVTLQFASLSFDVSFQETFSTWCSGGTLVVVPEEVRRDPPALLSLLEASRAERLFLPFVALQQLAVAAVGAGAGSRLALTEVITAGEQLFVTPQIVAFFAALAGAGVSPAESLAGRRPHTKTLRGGHAGPGLPLPALHNHYGPSETHAATALVLAGDPAGWPASPSIGSPIGNCRVFVLDGRWALVPAGVPGEVWIGGEGVARGYAGRPDLTAERFLPDPFGAAPGARLYRTGDLARWAGDGTLEFLGRRDRQVKIRGHRVELAEVESALARHPAVGQTAVLARAESTGTRRLVACVVPVEGSVPPAPGTLRAFLAEMLPDYMVPTGWVLLPEMPLTPSGKVDRRALARLAADPQREEQRAFVPPRTPAEELVAGIWGDVLGIAGGRVGIDDDFFDLGGHSLLATQVVSRLRAAFGVDLPLRRLFETPTVAGLAAAALAVRAVGAGPAPPTPAITRVDRTAALPLSFAQERLWVLSRLQGGGAAYNLPLALRVGGPLSAPVLTAALGEIVRRHEALRTVFAERGGEPVQVVCPAVPWRLPVADLAALPAAARGRELRRLGAAESVRPFDLATGPLLRATLLALGPGEHALLLNMHHIVSDGWSMGVLVREMEALYGALSHGEPSPLPELPVQYADFARWQRAWLRGEVLERQLAYWRERLRGLPAGLELPTDHPRPAVQTFRGATLPAALGGELSTRLTAFARGEGVTPFMALLGGFAALLGRSSGQSDVAIGSPIANRNRVETEGLIGFFVNTLVLRLDLAGDPSWGELLAQVREVTLGAYAHQDLPFEKLVEELQPQRDLSRSPLFQVALALQNAPLPALDLGGLALTPEPLPSGTAKFDLALTFDDSAAGLSGGLEYATDLYDGATAARLVEHFRSLLAGALADPGRRVSELPLLSPAERHQLVAEWNDTGAPFPGEVAIHQLFEARADRSPAALAAVCEGEALTYGALEARANRLAHLLRRLGAAPGVPVGIWMERSLDMLVSVLAVLKAGGTYLPLDAAWPADRAEAILAGAGARLLLSGPSLLPQAQALHWRLPGQADLVCPDVAAERPEPEPLDPSGVRELWDYVALRAVDRATAGGFVSSFTGEPFAEAEVDEYRDRVVALAAPFLGPAARVLEVGCGSGLVMWEVVPHVGSYLGIDPSPVTQERNRAHAAAHGHHNVELEVGFAHEIGALPPGSFDLVILASTVQFFPGYLYLERVIELAMRLLAPGGALLLADVMDPRRQAELQRALAEHHAAHPEARVSFKGSGSGRELLVDEGFFRDVEAAHPEVGAVEVLHRRQGFANELRFRYDAVLRKAAGEGLASPGRARTKRLWTGWHLEREPADRLPAAAGPDDVAYVIHTSGSTGAPKGIAVQHRPAVNLIDWVNGTFGVGSGDRVLFVTALSFDLSVWDVCGILAAGGTVHVAPEAALHDPQHLARLLAEAPITIWDSAPAALQQLVPFFPPPESPPRPDGSRLRLVLLSGDWIPVPLPDAVRAAFPGARVVSLGGATEATVWSNWYPIGEVDPRWASIPYGRPIRNARYHVLDPGLSPCPIGVPGDLYIGGGCLATGYARQPELTARSFVPDPFADRPGERLYRTGDRARSRPDGNLEFLGRVDQQVKVRGFRIELGEIEVALGRHPAVREAVVAAREDGGEKRLVAYLVTEPAAAAPPARELRAFLQETLPEYMVPWTYVHLQSLPVTANGKLDRQALPAPQAAPRESAPVAPRTELERAIAAAWREVLGAESIGVHDNFFESGGSSLLVVKLHGRLEQALGREIPVVELFKHPTIDALVKSLGDEPAAETGVERARARTQTRRDSMRQLQEMRSRRRGRGE